MLVDGNLVGLTTPTSIFYYSYSTSSFTVAAGVHTIQFVGMDPLGGDSTAFLDEMAI